MLKLKCNFCFCFVSCFTKPLALALILVSLYMFQETKKQYVTQISICLDKNFGPIDCGKEKRSFKEPSTTISSGLQSCVHSKPVYYPVFHALHKADDTLYFKPNNAQ